MGTAFQLHTSSVNKNYTPLLNKQPIILFPRFITKGYLNVVYYSNIAHVIMSLFYTA